MDTVFPSSREERCPRHDCESQQVERLQSETEFARLRATSSGHALFLCLTCQRPFKLVREPGAAAATRRGRPRPVARLER
jgi:hypothetical protein